MRIWLLVLLAVASIGAGSPLPSPSVELPPAPIASRLKPNALHGILTEREISSRASLEDLSDKPPSKHYEISAAMAVDAPVDLTRSILTDYRLYAKMVPYIDRADFSDSTKLLDLEGGIWKFRMRSRIRFAERSDHWIHYEIVAGAFAGLVGNIFFEPTQDGKTLVYFDGSQTAPQFPPKFVIERGAEIVFEFTAKRMRSYIESQKKGAPPNDPQIPRPRSHL